MSDKYVNLGKVEYDDLITDTVPHAVTGGSYLLRDASDIKKYKRGTLIGENISTGKTEVVGVGAASMNMNFAGDGTTKVFNVSLVPRPAKLTSVRINLDEVDPSEYTYQRGTGELIFKTAPETGKTITVEAAVTADSYRGFGILCNDEEIKPAVSGGEVGVNVVVYKEGCFDPNKIILASGSVMDTTLIDNLRIYGIELKAAQV